MDKKESFENKTNREQAAIDWYLNHKRKQDIYMLSLEAPDKYSCFDNWITSGATEFIVEVKVREDYTAQSIDRMGGAYLEHTKLAGIINYREVYQHTEPILYFNFFKNELRIYEVHTDPTMYSWEQKYLQKDDYDKSKIWKWVTKLDKSMLVETIKYK